MRARRLLEGGAHGRVLLRPGVGASRPRSGQWGLGQDWKVWSDPGGWGGLG